MNRAKIAQIRRKVTTQPSDNTNVTEKDKGKIKPDHLITHEGGGVKKMIRSAHLSQRIRLHARTLRKARLQAQVMVHDGFSAQTIQTYLQRWSRWWGRISEIGSHQKILQDFLETCRDEQLCLLARDLCQPGFTSRRTSDGKMLALGQPV